MANSSILFVNISLVPGSRLVTSQHSRRMGTKVNSGTYQSFKRVKGLHVQGSRRICRSFRERSSLSAESWWTSISDRHSLLRQVLLCGISDKDGRPALNSPDTNQVTSISNLSNTLGSSSYRQPPSFLFASRHLIASRTSRDAFRLFSNCQGRSSESHPGTNAYVSYNVRPNSWIVKNFSRWSSGTRSEYRELNFWLLKKIRCCLVSALRSRYFLPVILNLMAE